MKQLTINPNNRQYYSEDFIKGFKCGTQRQLEADKADIPTWIPCSERLPDDDDRVLTYDTDGDINIMWFDGRDEDGKDVWKDDYSIEWCDIVAWQPLPEPWKGADDE